MPPRPIVLAAVALACGTGFALVPTGTAYAQAAPIESAPPPARPDAVVRPATAEKSSPTASSWYGYQILAADALATFLFFEGVETTAAGPPAPRRPASCTWETARPSTAFIIIRCARW